MGDLFILSIDLWFTPRQWQLQRERLENEPIFVLENYMNAIKNIQSVSILVIAIELL